MIIRNVMANVVIDNQRYDFSMPIDISIPLRFNGPQPNAYGVEPATSVPCEAGELIGDTRRRGSCNFEQYTLIPHCNGTHTECVGHITHERIAVRDCLVDAFLTAVVVSVEPETAPAGGETYAVEMRPGDRVIPRRKLEEVLDDTPQSNALIIRTLPNDDDKLTKTYADDIIPPYFTTEAMDLIVEYGFEHLVVDLPSIDRLYDDGKLSNHRIFWKVDQGSFELGEVARRQSTITEFAYIPNDVPDGRYLLNLQIAPFASDASPSRPLLFPASEK